MIIYNKMLYLGQNPLCCSIWSSGIKHNHFQMVKVKLKEMNIEPSSHPYHFTPKTSAITSLLYTNTKNVPVFLSAICQWYCSLLHFTNWINYSLPPSTKVKKKWRHKPTPPVYLHAMDNDTFNPLIIITYIINKLTYFLQTTGMINQVLKSSKAQK